MTYNVFGGTLSLTQSVSRSDHFFTVFLHHCYTCPILDNICPSSPWFARFPVCTDTSFPACTQVHMQWMPGGRSVLRKHPRGGESHPDSISADEWWVISGTFNWSNMSSCVSVSYSRGATLLCSSSTVWELHGARWWLCPAITSLTTTSTGDCLCSYSCVHSPYLTGWTSTWKTYRSSSSIFISAMQTKTYNFNIINLTKPGNQKGKCPSCWPPIAQTK